MINLELLEPRHIAIVGGSNNLAKPGGRVVSNLIKRHGKSEVYVVNNSGEKIQGIETFSTVEELPDEIDLAIIAIPAKHCSSVVDILITKKQTKAFIILSAGFGEAGQEGKIIEQEIVAKVDAINGCLIGPNCIGFLNANYAGVFTLPIPEPSTTGCDLISNSGATAVFLMEAGIPLGIKFAQVYSLGNAAQTSVEDVLEYMDKNYDPAKDAKIKLLYLESINDPVRFQKHAKSLTAKGVKIAAIKAGSTNEGSRAASSHTGALSSSDQVVRALFKKSNVIYCSSRMELLSVASIYHYGEMHGENVAIITHAGGSAVMLTDSLIASGLKVPKIEGAQSEKLLSYLYPGSSVANPIDFLATGTAEQLGIIIDYCEHKFEQIDAMVVVFGSPGLFDVKNVYDVLSVKLDICKKPIYPVLPSVVNAQKEIQHFLDKGHINFPDEVALGKALGAIYKQKQNKALDHETLFDVDVTKIRKIIEESKDGYLSPNQCNQLLDLIEIPRAKDVLIQEESKLESTINSLQFPVAMKVVGPIHKSDGGGVILNVQSPHEVKEKFIHLMDLPDVTAVQIQSMMKGEELFIGVKKESPFGHLIIFGLGGIFIEILQDFVSALCPISKEQASSMLKDLKGYKLFEGYRGKKGINALLFAELIARISYLTQIVPEIEELDINPLMGNEDSIVAVDVRIRISKI